MAYIYLKLKGEITKEKIQTDKGKKLKINGIKIKGGKI